MTQQLLIGRIGQRGDGVADGPDGPLYVPYALPGESVTAEPVPGHPDSRHLLRVEIESPDRVPAICPHFGVCGGCAIQHWTSERYRAWKRELVVTALAQAGSDAPVDDLVDAHGEGRRRAVLHARRGTHDVLNVGFAAPRAHHIVPIDRCPVLAPGLSAAVKTAWALAEAVTSMRKPLDIHITATDAGLDVDLRGSGPLSPSAHAALVRIATQLRLARLTRHGELLAQSGTPTIRMGRAAVPLPPGAFLQATAEGEAVLGRLIAEHADGSKTALDLFAGVGPFALRLAEKVRVTAADSDAPALAALEAATKTTSGLRPVTVLRRDLFRHPMMAEEMKTFTAVVFDPPRQGAEAQSRALAVSRVPCVVAVSCNPATFARDARILIDGGYRLERVTPVDQFRYSAHVELVARFTR